MGPSTPLCRPQSFLAYVFLWVFRQKGFCLGLLYRCFALGKRVWSFEPLKLRTLFRLLVLVLSGPPLGGGCIVTMTFFSTTRVGRQE